MQKLVQEITSTNYMPPEIFYKKFLFWLVRLHISLTILGLTPPMSANHFCVAFRIQYGCGLRISEVLNLEKRDFNLARRLLTIRDAKTGKNQKTTILPYDVSMLEQFLKEMDPTDKLFSANRHTMWRYAKQTGHMAGLNIFESQSNREVEGYGHI